MEDTQGLPDVKGLGDFIVQDVQDKVTEPPVQTQKPEVKVEDLDLGQFTNPKDILKSYKEIQGFTTRVSQENKQLKEQLAQFQAQLQEQQELMKYQRPIPVPQQPQQKDFDSMFIENPQQAVASVASRTVQQQMIQARIAEALEEEHIKNPSEYQERFSYAQQLSNQYPQLTQSAPGIKKLFEMADKFRKEDYQKKGMAFVKAVIGEDADFEKFKTLLRKEEAGKLTQTNNAYMPDTSTSRNRTDTDTRKPGYDTEIQASVAKGDVDNVIANVFRKALET